MCPADVFEEFIIRRPSNSNESPWFEHRGPAQSVWVADCYFIGNVLDLPFASPIAIYR